MRHSQHANDPPVNSWVTCEHDGTVEAGHCTCMAGLGVYLESASWVSTTCTQIGCVWKEPHLVETIPYAQIMDISFTKPKGSIGCYRKRGAHLYNDSLPLSEFPQCSQAQPQQGLSVAELADSTSELELNDNEMELLVNDEVEHSFEPESIPGNEKSLADFSFFQLLWTPPSDEDKLAFLTENERFDPVINSIISPLSDKFKTVSPVINLPSPLRDLYQPENEELTYPELKAVCEQVMLTITEEEIRTVEEATRHQSKGTAWFVQRAGRITASVMKHVCVTDPGNPSQSLIRQICYPEIHNFSSKATKWGCEHEMSARSAYADIMKNVHSGFVCKESGLTISITYPKG